MMMKMAQILEFKSFYNGIKDTQLPIKTAYKFSKLIRKLDEEIKFYQTQFQHIIEKYGEKDENGKFKLTEDKQGVSVKQENIEACQKELSELHNLDIEISDISFNLDELASLNMTIEQMSIIMSLIEES